ncbi:MAG: 5-(carboxyamino)imidazole ribonucleotide synthase [Proteobacteria bacterium]|jgi:5-(carboxyamino)imidazole ribonucleotide synthase|nr:5-(carboxyamino)imidazole ribonucleotide synthase [Alphaproteobacteria bacterium]NCC03138.1 5-(carboxyamino)imidazole ribonucleotide synthase [Pseudomonadota bacterium]
MKTLPTGSVIGILGGGQLGRMTAMAAARLGYRCHIYCPESEAPALDVCAFHTQGDFDDEGKLAVFARSVDVVTLEWENVPLHALDVIAQYTPVHPGASVLKIAQDRGLEKSFARKVGIGTADFTLVNSSDELEEAIKNYHLPVLLKSTRMGYDGKGQVKIVTSAEARAAWVEMGSRHGIVEALVDFACEISVIVARREDGKTVAYPPVQNTHRNHILNETVAPAPLSRDILDQAVQTAIHMAEELGVIGLLAVELFVLKVPDKDGQIVLLNEIAPRPHNSGHWTIDACSCNQFEMLVRAVCGLPLGSARPHHRAVMHNIVGDESDRFAMWLADPSACLHLYGKKETRDGRKMGHVTFLKEVWRD